MRSVTLRNALRLRPARVLTADAPGPGGIGVGYEGPMSGDGAVGPGERLSGDGPGAFGERGSGRAPVGPGEPLSGDGAAQPGETGGPRGPVPPLRGKAGEGLPTEPVDAAGAPPRRGEDDAVRDVLGRLCRVYRSLDGAAVEHAVAEALDAFRQARVRAFVPILVERRARAALDAAARRPRPAPREGKPLSAP